MAIFGQCCLLIVWTIFFTNFFTKAEISLSCDPGWQKTSNGARCVKIFRNQKKTWLEARKACRSIRGDLLTIRDKEMSNFIKERFVYNDEGISIWIGLRKLSGGNGWHWLDERRPPSYTDWHVKPEQSVWSKYNKDLCAFLKNLKQGGAAWFVWTCRYKVSYICQKPIAYPCRGKWIKTPRFDSCVIVYRDPKSWNGARYRCQKYGADLLTIRNDTMSNFLRDRIVAHLNFPMWIGFHKSTGTDRWHWLEEDATPTYTNWEDGYPYKTTRKCAGLKKIGREASWLNFDCSLEQGFICERPPPPYCYYKGRSYRDGTQITLSGNSHKCINAEWRPIIPIKQPLL
ncbi:macrophage mannose receptor 1 [Plakobranchus ocellatus]|uniref:Macrophage mannose receptor 1 n=1 Tax=Plakobranchus ocellatus TaxID=259542 RepID=A0AAV4DT03_9GAST|nr:macrophage mannose receptor 1 [Plakobranchus ocellatus]